VNLDSLHLWLFGATRYDPVTVVELMEELEELRRGPHPETWDDLPTDGISAQELLLKLEAEGRAVRDGTFWRWAEGRKEAKQASLF
jgi:hypothetical protein